MSKSIKKAVMPSQFKKYKQPKDLYTDLSLTYNEIEFLFKYLFQFGAIYYDQEKKILLLDTEILNYKQNITENNITYKIRLIKDVLS